MRAHGGLSRDVVHPLDATRLRKTAEVLAEERLHGDLLVCMRGFRRDRRNLNCGRCSKCARVLLQAEADGRLARHSLRP